jgi:hypothetical protein
VIDAAALTAAAVRAQVGDHMTPAMVNRAARIARVGAGAASTILPVVAVFWTADLLTRVFSDQEAAWQAVEHVADAVAAWAAAPAGRGLGVSVTDGRYVSCHGVVELFDAAEAVAVGGDVLRAGWLCTRTYNMATWLSGKVEGVKAWIERQAKSGPPPTSSGTP